MLVSTPVYFVSTKSRPCEFLSEYHSPVNALCDSAIYFDRRVAENEIDCCDEPEEYEIIQGRIIVDI